MLLLQWAQVQSLVEGQILHSMRHDHTQKRRVSPSSSLCSGKGLCEYLDVGFSLPKEKELELDRHKGCLLRYSCWGRVEGPPEQKDHVFQDLQRAKPLCFPGRTLFRSPRGVPVVDLGQMLLGQALWRARC